MKSFNRVRADLEVNSILTNIQEVTDFTFVAFDFLSPDGLQEAPQGSFYATGEWYRLAEKNGSKFVVEGVADDQYGLSSHRGGVIVFSTDVNAVNQGTGLLGKLRAWASNSLGTVKNRLTKDKKLSAIIKKHNKSNPEDLGVGAFSVGNLFNGRYISGDNVFDEKSAAIEILGVPSETLLLLGTEIANEFKQETVLIKDFNRNKFYLADRKRANPATELQKLN